MLLTSTITQMIRIKEGGNTPGANISDHGELSASLISSVKKHDYTRFETLHSYCYCVSEDQLYFIREQYHCSIQLVLSNTLKQCDTLQAVLVLRDN